MASHIQLVMYEGYLAADPEMRYTPAGKPVTNFRIGSTRSFKNSAGEATKQTTWIKVTCWNSLAEIANNYCAKGSHVIVQGALHPGENGAPNVYEMSNGRGWAATYELTADKLRIIEGKDRADSETTEEEALPFA